MRRSDRQWVDNFAHPDRAYMCGELVQFTLDQLPEVVAHDQESPGWEEAWRDDYLTRRDKIK